MQKHNMSILEELALSPKENSIIAVVGGGGKTSLIFRLLDEFKALGKKVIITTTTHMYYEVEHPFSENGEAASIQKQLTEYGYVIAGRREQDTGKIGSLSEERLKALLKYCDIMLIEADGAKHKPIKIPGSHEPVIPDWADTVIGVLGLDALGKPIREAAHRPALLCSFLGKTEEMTIHILDLEKIILSKYGLRKNTENKEFRILLNKSDVLKNEQDIEEIEQLRKRLLEKGDILAIASLKQEGES